MILLLLLPLLLLGSQRIIALSPSISEIVFGLGKGAELVGVSEYASYPEAVKKIFKIGGYSNPSLERIFSLEPSLVIGQTHYDKTLRQLEQLGIETLALEMDTIANIKVSILKIAEAIHADPRPLLAPIDEAVKKAEASKPSGKRVLIVYGLSLDLNRGLYVAGHNIFYEEIIQLCGAKNAFDKVQLSQPVLHYEALIDLNPDMVILLHRSSTDGEVDYDRARELWYTIPIAAAKTRQIYIMNGEHLSIPSHRIAQSIGDICEVISK